MIRSQSPEPEGSKETASANQKNVSVDPRSSSGKSGVAAAPSAKGRRHATIEAPAPKKPDTAKSVSESGKAEDTQDSVESFFDSVLSPDANTEEASSQFNASGLEPTALTTADSSGRNDLRNRNSESFQFGGEDLPRERTAKTGSTPQWAGFPGQKKSF